jgi:hypothetical protein
MDDFHQTAIQSASGDPNVFQKLVIRGDTDHESGGDGLAPPTVSTDGQIDVCRIQHDAQNNTSSTHFVLSVNPCVGPVVVRTTCSSVAPHRTNTGFCTPPPGGSQSVLGRRPT